MTELEKYQKVNQAETIEQLCECILSFADESGMIKGRTRDFNAAKMVRNARLYHDGEGLVPNVITREYGLRQQAMYLKYYK